MSESTNLYAVKSVIRIIRNQRVILDSDLAKLYGVTTKALNQAIKRNADKFPADFMFQLDRKEVRMEGAPNGASNLYLPQNKQVEDLRSQIVTLDSQHADNQDVTTLTPKNIGKNKQGKHVKHLPFAFTEHGATMAAMVLNSSASRTCAQADWLWSQREARKLSCTPEHPKKRSGPMNEARSSFQFQVSLSLYST
jgi:hypothetical protein